MAGLTIVGCAAFANERKAISNLGKLLTQG
jgi:hypothetical protein